MIIVFGAIVLHFADGWLWFLFWLLMFNPMKDNNIGNGQNNYKKQKRNNANNKVYHVFAIGVIVMVDIALS